MNDNEREERVMKHPRCKHGWMSSCLHGCEDAYRWSDDDRVMIEMIDEMNWEMLLRAFGMEVSDDSR